MLCSDGLNEVVRDEEISDVLARMESPENACRALVELALDRGAPDNVTVLAARFGVEREPVGSETD
jgi:protein phosphatase